MPSSGEVTRELPLAKIFQPLCVWVESLGSTHMWYLQKSYWKFPRTSFSCFILSVPLNPWFDFSLWFNVSWFDKNWLKRSWNPHPSQKFWFPFPSTASFKCLLKYLALKPTKNEIFERNNFWNIYIRKRSVKTVENLIEKKRERKSNLEKATMVLCSTHTEENVWVIPPQRSESKEKYFHERKMVH